MSEEKTEKNGSVMAFANATQTVVDLLNKELEPIGDKLREVIKSLDEHAEGIDKDDEEIKLQLEETRCFLEEMLDGMSGFWDQGRMVIESNISVLKKSGG